MNSPFIVEEMPWFIKMAIVWLSGKPIIAALLCLVLLDWISGICRAFITKTLSSTISWRGMVRKVFMLLLIGVAAVLQPFAGGLPLVELVSISFCVTEALSIVENAAASKVPLPRALVDALAKLREQSDQKRLPLERHADVQVNLPAGSSHTVQVSTKDTDPPK